MSVRLVDREGADTCTGNLAYIDQRERVVQALETALEQAKLGKMRAACVVWVDSEGLSKWTWRFGRDIATSQLLGALMMAAQDLFSTCADPTDDPA